MRAKEIKEVFGVENASFACACDPKYGMIGRGDGKGRERDYEPLEVYQIVLVDRLRKMGVVYPKIGELVRDVMEDRLWRFSVVIVEVVEELELMAHMRDVKGRLEL